MKKALAWEQGVLSNGLSFLYRQDPGVPLAAGTLLIRSGSRFETPDQAGLASLTAELMLQGTLQRSARQIALDVESIGASLGVQAAEDFTEFGYIVPEAQLDRILDVLADLLTEPQFPSSEIKKERASVLASLESRKDSIFNLAYDSFNSSLYGRHPYSRLVDGRKETITRFQRADFQAWHRTYIQPNRAVFSMVASLPFRQIQRQVEKRLGGWKQRPGGWTEIAAPAPGLEKSLRIRLHSRFEQAYLMTGVFAPAIQDPDYLTLKVLNTLFGSGMSSRLFLRLREEMGLAYEVSSFSPAHVHTSQWVVYLGTPPEKLAIAKKEMERLLETLQRKEPEAQEIRQAIAMIKGAYVMEHQTRRRQAWYAAWWVYLGRSPEYGEQFLKDIQKVTAERAHALAKRLLSQPRVTVEMLPGRSK